MSAFVKSCRTPVVAMRLPRSRSVGVGQALTMRAKTIGSGTVADVPKPSFRQTGLAEGVKIAVDKSLVLVPPRKPCRF